MFNLIFVTCSNKDEANGIAKELLEKNLVACANVLKDVCSLFKWENKIERSDEVMMILKARQEDFEAIEAKILSLHSYEVPEIIAIAISHGNQSYLNWIKEVTEKVQ